MENYLSIGEVAKIKGISCKALRYYEKIGILKPVMINQETGYRYYSNDQLVIIDIILTCMDFDIPLKQFKNYIKKDNSFDLEKLLVDGNKLVEAKIKNLQYKKQFLLDLSLNANRSDKIKNNQDFFIEEFKKRYFLILPSSDDFKNYSQISKTYTDLVFQCKSLNSSDGLNQGIIYLKENDKLLSYAFLQVSNLNDSPNNLYIVPSKKYKCKVLTLDELNKIDKFKNGMIIKELFELNLSPHKRLFELQIPID